MLKYHFNNILTDSLVIHCPSLEVPEYGNISTQEAQYQIKVNYSCDLGYELNSTEDSKVCRSDGQWFPHEDVTCQSKQIIYVMSICFMYHLLNIRHHIVNKQML